MSENNPNPVSKQIAHAANIENQEYVEKLIRKKKIKSYILIVLGSIIYSIGVVWILQIGQFFSSGVTGTSQIIVRLPTLWGGKSLENYLGLLMGLINTPLIIWSWRGVSKRYAVLTVISIAIQTIFTTLLTNFTISPFATLLDGSGLGLVEAIKEGKLNIFNRSEEMLQLVENFKADMATDTGTKVILAIIGGGVTGIGAALCLKAGGSTGGIDVVSSYLQMKKRVSFTKYQSIIDCIIIFISTIFDVERVLYTLIRLYVYLKVIDMIYNSYKITRIEVITSKGEELRKALIGKFYHGVTIFDAVGGYTLAGRKVLEMYVSAYEVQDYLHIINVIDPGAFVVSTQVKIMAGRYIQKTIA